MAKRKSKVPVKVASEKLSKLREEFEGIYKTSQHLGEKHASKEIALQLKQLEAKFQLRLKMLPNYE
jgi:hypothetical protein